MKIVTLILCLFITCLQINLFINQLEIEKRIKNIIENQLKIQNYVSLDKVDTDFQIEFILNKIKDLEKKK